MENKKKMFDHQYVNMNRLNYDGAQFIPVCDTCKRFVKRDESVKVNGLGELSPEPNCTCSKCGRSHMIFEGWF